ncbi:MAG: NAD(P)/FAD-dependent oxidoreductase, partial [Gammaproteobacteria bacterium]|nr:NAD(P)/FAD-dependent oxidoreductase [Gammaproteobacteria bacterium]
MMRYNVRIQLNVGDIQIIQRSKGFSLTSHHQSVTTENLVIATGGLSIPSMGSSPFAYQVAKQFGIPVIETRPGLVPFTLHEKDKTQLSPLAGMSMDVIATTDENTISFRENMLFTHRGLSGPAILQISSYWQSKKNIYLNLLPDINIFEYLKNQQQQSPKVLLKTVLASRLPSRFV